MFEYGYVITKDFFSISTLYTAFKKTYPSDFSFVGEYHNFWELLIVTDGKINVTAGSEVLLLQKGQAILHKPMEFHSLSNEGDSRMQTIVFSFGAENMPHSFPQTFDISDYSVPEKIVSHISTAFKISGINIIDKADSDLACALAVKELEAFILSLLAQKSTTAPIIKSKPAKNYTAIVKILENNIDKPLSITEIARICNMSETNLKKTFSRYAGMSIIHYFNLLKMNAAISMLECGLSVNETAQRLGFANQNYFSTAFKRSYGMSPTHYMKYIYESKNSDLKI